MVRALLLILFLPSTFAGQQFPVQCHASLSQPHSSYLPEMARDLELVLELTDLSEPSLDIVLKFEVRGNGFLIQTNLEQITQPVTLYPGVPFGFSRSDLEYYLESDKNLFAGINFSEYEDLRRFPEGQYEICIKALAFDHPNLEQVSNEVCLNEWFVLADPPLLSLPVCGDDLPFATPSDLIFQWEPLHGALPHIEDVTYMLEVWEVYPTDADPETVALSQFPLFSHATSSTQYVYSITDPILYPVRDYCWRVTVRDANGAALFNNQGRSEVCTFSLTEDWNLPFEFTLQAFPQSHRRALLQWNEYAMMREYLLQVRKAGSLNWFEFTPDSGSLVLTGLEAGTEYEARVKGLLDEEESEWSPITTFTTHQVPVHSCNASALNLQVPTGQPALNLITGSYVQCGDFDIQIGHASQGSMPGFFSGSGKTRALPGLSVNVEYRNLFVNRDLEVEAGEVHAVTQGISAWSGQWSYQSSSFYNGVIDSVFTGNGLIYIISENGDTSILQEDFSGGLLITDQNGDQWIVNPDGSVTPVGGTILLPVSMAPLSALELEVLGRALALLRNEFPASRIDSLYMVSDGKKQVVQTGIRSQQQMINPGAAEGDPAFFASGTATQAESSSLSVSNAEYKSHEFLLLESKVLYHLSHNLTEVPQMNYFGSFLRVENKTYSTWLAQKKEEGITNEQAARLLADSGIRELIRTVIRLKLQW